MEADKVDAKYKRMRLQVFLGIFIGYAGFYIVRKNFSMAIPELALLGFDQSELSIVLAMNAVAYALSKFLMGSVSDRSNARVFLPLGLVLAALSMMFMIVPVTLLGPEHKRLAIFIMAVLNFLVGWFNGMGWPPCGRVYGQQQIDHEPPGLCQTQGVYTIVLLHGFLNLPHAKAVARQVFGAFMAFRLLLAARCNGIFHMDTAKEIGWAHRQPNKPFRMVLQIHIRLKSIVPKVAQQCAQVHWIGLHFRHLKA